MKRLYFSRIAIIATKMVSLKDVIGSRAMKVGFIIDRLLCCRTSQWASRKNLLLDANP
jgi:hypothetical protein